MTIYTVTRSTPGRAFKVEAATPEEAVEKAYLIKGWPGGYCWCRLAGDDEWTQYRVQITVSAYGSPPKKTHLPT